MPATIDNPILNAIPQADGAFRLDADNEVTATIDQGRRWSSNFPPITALKKKAVPSLFDADHVVETRADSKHVEDIPWQVKCWRELGWPDVTPVTRMLVQHWTRGERYRPLVENGW